VLSGIAAIPGLDVVGIFPNEDVNARSIAPLSDDPK
jgi:hypothetical protein